MIYLHVKVYLYEIDQPCFPKDFAILPTVDPLFPAQMLRTILDVGTRLVFGQGKKKLSR